MRLILPLLLPLLLSACADPVSVAVFGRGLGDMAVSAYTGRDCSAVRLERGHTYCAAREGPAPRQLVCTRSLGVPDCWTNPEAFAVPPRGIADGPALTPAQEEHRQAPWPKSLNAGL